MQGQFSDGPTLGRVYVSWGERRGEGPTAFAAIRDMVAHSPTAGADTAIAARWQRARRLAAQADSALTRGDLREFARLYEELKRLLNVGRPKLAPVPRPR